MTTFYQTKYALTGGVQVIEGELTSGGEYVSFKPHGFSRLGRDIFTTETEAKVDAEKRRIKKIAALKKQITNLEKLSF